MLSCPGASAPKAPSTKSGTTTSPARNWSRRASRKWRNGGISPSPPRARAARAPTSSFSPTRSAKAARLAAFVDQLRAFGNGTEVESLRFLNGTLHSAQFLVARSMSLATFRTFGTSSLAPLDHSTSTRLYRGRMEGLRIFPSQHLPARLAPFTTTGNYRLGASFWWAWRTSRGSSRAPRAPSTSPSRSPSPTSPGRRPRTFCFSTPGRRGRSSTRRCGGVSGATPRDSPAW